MLYRMYDVSIYSDQHVQ